MDTHAAAQAEPSKDNTAFVMRAQKAQRLPERGTTSMFLQDSRICEIKLRNNTCGRWLIFDA